MVHLQPTVAKEEESTSKATQVFHVTACQPRSVEVNIGKRCALRLTCFTVALFASIARHRVSMRHVIVCLCDTSSHVYVILCVRGRMLRAAHNAPGVCEFVTVCVNV